MERIKRIKRIKIGATYYPIIWLHTDLIGRACGEWVKDSNIIYIANELSPLKEQEALIHEIFHIINERIEDEDEVEIAGENVVQHMAFYIQNIIQDNPELDVFKRLDPEEDYKWRLQKYKHNSLGYGDFNKCEEE